MANKNDSFFLTLGDVISHMVAACSPVKNKQFLLHIRYNLCDIT